MATNSGPTLKWWTRLFNGLKSFFQSSLEWLSSFLPKRTRKSTPDSSKLPTDNSSNQTQPTAPMSPSTPRVQSNAPIISPPQDKVDSLGRTLLMRAVAEHDIETVRELLESGVDVNRVNEKATGDKEDPDTALGIAINTIRLGAAVDLEIIKLLLEHKASIKRNKLPAPSTLYTQTVLDYFPLYALSIMQGKEEEVRKYRQLEKEVFSLVANTGNLFFYPENNHYFRMALETGHIATVQNILNFVRSNHVPVEVYQEQIYSKAFFSLYGQGTNASLHAPIPYALQHNQTEMALFLLKNALTDLNGATRQDVLNEALVFACYYNNASVVEFCLKNGVSKEISSYTDGRMGLTALMAAAYMGNMSIVEQLLKNDIDINHIHGGQPGKIPAYDKTPGTTALYCAIISDQNKQTKEAMVHLLLNNGAKLNSRTLKAMVDSGFVLNLEKVPNLIEYLDEPEYDSQPYRQIIDQIKEHNETLRHRIAQGIDVTNMPKPITHMVTEYLLGEKRSSEGSDRPKEIGPSGNKPPGKEAPPQREAESAPEQSPTTVSITRKQNPM